MGDIKNGSRSRRESAISILWRVQRLAKLANAIWPLRFGLQSTDALIKFTDILFTILDNVRSREETDLRSF